MATKKIIVSINLLPGDEEIRLGSEGDDGYILTAIEHKRDGATGLYKPGDADESSYWLEYRSSSEGKDFYTYIVPTRCVAAIKFKVVEVQKDAPPQPRRAEE